MLSIGCAAPGSAPDAAARGAPEPLPSAPEAAVTTEASFDRCERCHVAIAAEHARSMHARAAIDPLFQRELARVPDPTFCLACHGADRDPPGLGCGSCHGDEVILATRETGRAPHPVRVAPSLGTDEVCAGCHQFDFPGRAGEPMQATLDEATLLGPERARCVDCHAGASGHAFEVSDAMLAASIHTNATARREGTEVHVRLTLRAGEVGHAVPTGDVYRRLEVRAWLVGAAGSLRSATLSRVFRAAPDGLHELADRRVPATGSRLVELALPVPDGADPADPAEVRWTIEWHALPREEVERSEAAGVPIEERWWRREIASGRIPL